MNKDLLDISKKIDAMREENRGTDKKIDALLRTAQLLAQALITSNDRAEAEYAERQSERAERQAVLRALERQDKKLDKQLEQMDRTSNLLAALTTELLKRNKPSGHDKNGGNGRKK
ncbi:MAG: hypothetical protein IAF08_01940 [Rhizobacter sp.]|nr:hypothetical protein [Chlorobiales bacterium]